MPSPSSRQKRMCWRPSAAQRGIWREMEQTPGAVIEGGNAAGQSGGDALRYRRGGCRRSGTDQSAGGTGCFLPERRCWSESGTGTDAAAQTAQTNEYLAQGYYIVQEGDKPLDISRKAFTETTIWWRPSVRPMELPISIISRWATGCSLEPLRGAISGRQRPPRLPWRWSRSWRRRPAEDLRPQTVLPLVNRNLWRI